MCTKGRDIIIATIGKAIEKGTVKSFALNCTIIIIFCYPMISLFNVISKVAKITLK